MVNGENACIIKGGAMFQRKCYECSDKGYGWKRIPRCARDDNASIESL